MFPVCGIRPREVRRQMITAKEAMQRYSNPLFNPWVIGGVDAKMHAYPWVVQLKRPNAPTPGCGGGVINSRIEFLNFEINTFGKLLLWLSSLPICTKNTTILREKLVTMDYTL